MSLPLLLKQLEDFIVEQTIQRWVDILYLQYLFIGKVTLSV